MFESNIPGDELRHVPIILEHSVNGNRQGEGSVWLRQTGTVLRGKRIRDADTCVGIGELNTARIVESWTEGRCSRQAVGVVCAEGRVIDAAAAAQYRFPSWSKLIGKAKPWSEVGP